MLAAMSAQPAIAADLNALLNDQPTIGSEVSRGAAASFQCELNHEADSVAFGKCVSDAANADEQRHPDYAAFELGLYWQECVLRSIILGGDKQGHMLLDDVELRHSKTVLVLSYQQFRRYQRQLGLTDEQLVTAYAAGDPAWRPLVQQLHDWEKHPPKVP
ncbi:MAG TPA: hypothetical protein VGM17_15285 [Rhizomicrobium sp.]